MSTTPFLFVDTNVILQLGSELRAPELTMLVDLSASGRLKVITTDLTCTEIAKHFARHDMQKLPEVWRADLRASAQTHLDLTIPEISREVVWDKVFRRWDLLVHGLMIRLGATELKIDDVKTSEIFEDYAHSRGFFGQAAKKDQFPDAFVFAALTGHVSSTAPLIILSRDRDFTLPAAQKPNVRCVDTFEALLEAVGLAKAGAKVAGLVSQFLSELSAAAEAELLQYSFEAEDVDDADIEAHEISGLQMSDFSSYEVVGSENTYLVYARVSFTAAVSFSHPDWENGMYDREDDRVYTYGRESGDVTAEVNRVPFSFILEHDLDTGTAVVSEARVRSRWPIYIQLHDRTEF